MYTYPMKRLAPTPETDSPTPERLLAQAASYLWEAEVDTLRRACTFAAEAHGEQKRASGDPYIAHPLAVALTLAEMRLDASALVAAVLHDVPEDTGVPLEDVEREFGAEVAHLVDGVTKLGKMHWLPEDADGDGHGRRGEESAWAESLRKMFLAMAEDIRVVLIKLADRLHNMRTLQYLPPHNQHRIAQETMDIYAPLANRLGIWQIKWQLEDLAFRYLEPEHYKTIARGLDGRPLEIQIRTYEMHHVAEYGVAAHWRYKEGGRRDDKFDAKVAWLRQLMDWQKDVVGSQEFVDSLKTDLFQDQVYVFTPRGEIKELPTGATPLDFAYRIHTEVGHRCVGAKVNGRLVPLSATLHNGDSVEIVTAKTTRGPSRDWLNPALGYLKTASAREKVRQWFRRQQREESITRGRELVEKELQRLGVSQAMGLDELARMFRYDRVDDFLAAVGYADLNTQQIATKLSTALAPAPAAPPQHAPVSDRPPRGLRVKGVSDLLTRLARCCSPVPGDDVVGFI